jgi:O-antigen/teichoic acid export membrane protein
MRRWLPDFWLILALFVIPLIFFLPVTIGGRTLIPADNLYQYEPWASAREEVGVPEVPHNGLLSDLVLQNYQWKTFIRQNISDGEIPLWQPNQLSGTPFLANGQHSALYPFSVIYYVLPLEMAYGWFTVIQLWLAGLWMYLYIRGIGLGRIAGMVAAVTVQLSGFFIVATVHPMIQAGAAWLPLILLMIEFTIQRRPFPATQGKPAMLPWVLIGGVGLSMSHLAGHIEITYYTLLVMALYASLRLLLTWLPNRQQWRSLVITGLMLIGMVVIGFAIGMVQFLPNVQSANNSFRASRPDSTLSEVRGFALPVRHVAKFLMPNVYGNPAYHDYFDVFDGEMISVQKAWEKSTSEDQEAPTINNTDFGIKNYVEGGGYVGILPLVLALYGLYAGFLQRRSKSDSQAIPYRLIFSIIAIISIVLMFGTPFYAILYYGLPGIDQLHTPFRWLFPLTICLAVLAAFGTEALSRSRGEDEYGAEYWKTEAADKPLYVVAKRGGWVLVYSGIAILVGLFCSRLFFDRIESLVDRVYQGLAKANTAFPDAKSFYSYEFRNVLLFGLIIIGVGAVIRVSRCPIYVGKGERRFPVWQLMAIGLIVVDLFAATFDFNTAAKKEWLAYTPPSIQWLQDHMDIEGPFRIQAYEWGEDPLHANAGWRYGLQDVRGYDSLFSQDYAEMMGEIVPQEGLPHNQIVPIIAYKYPRALDNPLLDLLNVRYIITDWIIKPEDDPQAMGFEEVYVDSGVRIYENMEALPRAYTAPLPNEGNSYAINEGCQEDISTETVDEADLQFIPPLSGACIPIQAADITQYDDTEIRIDAIVDQDSWLILADSYDAGWRAFIKPKGASDDEEQEIDVEQVNLDLRGVQLETGEWTVRFKYSPRSFQLGAFTSFVSGMLVIFLALLWFWQTFVSEQADEDTGRRLVKNSVAPIGLNLFNRGIDFAFAFIMLRILGPSDAGIYYYAIVVFGWFDIFTNFGLNTLLTRDVSRDRDAAGRYLFNTSLLRLGLAGLGIPVLGLVLLIRNGTVEPALDATAIIAIVLLYIGLIPNSISTGLTALFYAFEKAEFPAAMTTVSTLVKVTLGLGVLLLGWGVIGLAAVSIITNVVTFVVLTRLAYPLIRANWQPTRDGALQRTMLREAWPLMINHLLATVFFKSDVILMEAINGVRVVGTYSTAYKWLDALNIIPAFFTMALLPIMSRQAHENRDGLKQNYVLGIKLLVMVALPTAVMTTFLANALVGFLGGQEFLPDGAIALQLMIWSIPIGWMNSLTQYVLIALDRQRQITWAFIVAVSFNIITNLIFLSAYSFRAAAITTIFSELVLLVGFFWLMRSSLGAINWVRSLWQPVVASGVAFMVMWILWQRMPVIALGIGTITYLTLLWWLEPFSSQETARLSSILPGRLRRLILWEV